MGPVFIGTSGWTYKDWRGRFYPQKLPQREWLAYYTEHFPTVELNVTTYRLPKEHDLVRWANVPPGFVYTVKLSRLITHRKRPGEPKQFVDTYMARIAPLAPKIANVLAQFPPTWARDDDALRNFLNTLPPHHRYVVEFRHQSWYDEAVYALLRERGISLCLHDLAASVAPHVVTGPVLYVRLHGPVRAYVGSYRRVRLERWSAAIRDLGSQVEATYVYFNNDQHAYAPRNALTLQGLVGDAVVPWRAASASSVDATRRLA
ncbi:MAG TPA: DUF72 domain-containing protein [Candidatus Baltobacteraceae bacterium]|nr:DUF72 domain-containing protein [Candidatus Baltobacteraceae bacterium]